MEPNEFVDKQIALNKDMAKALSMFNTSQETQRNTNKLIADHIDAQALQIKTLRSIITGMNIISIMEFVLIGWLLVVVL